MKRNNYKYLLLSVVASAVLTACGGSSNDPVQEIVDPTPAPQNACPVVGNITPVDLGNSQCEVGGVLTENATLSADITWFLNDGLQVGTSSSLATLTVNAGTQVRGSGSDHVVVWPGSSIQANGTRANPIHFLSDDEGVDGSGEWGGLFLRGFEGLPTLQGNQGQNRLNYVVVAEGGAEVSVSIDGVDATYRDNIVLNGVDSETILSFVQSHNSARDGLHIRNGDPRLSWILSTGAGRDGIWYRDFNGLIKDLMVIHNRDTDGSTGRSGIYASRTAEGTSNPRIVNATLVGRDNSSEQAGDTSKEFGILFADNVNQIRMGNVLIANFRNGCYEAGEGANLAMIDANVPGPNYLDGVHCANEAGPNGNFGIVRAGATDFPAGTVAANNSINANGLVYYNGAAQGITFTGEFAERNFTAGWYLANIGGIQNGLAADSTSLNAFLDGDTNQDGVVNGDDIGAPFIISDANDFNLDVAGNTGGYDLTHIGSVRSGSDQAAIQFNDWTVATGADEGFAVQINSALQGDSACPTDLGGASVTSMARSGGRNHCEVSGTITADAVLTSNIDWFLNGGVQVGTAASVASLTIESGTRIHGGTTETETDYLLVYPGSRIDAQGTGARPVRFTSDDADINGTAEWGGLFLRGFNGLSSSGEQGANRLDYVVVAEAGAPTEVTVDGNTVNYQDNIVVNGVDNTTTLTFVQSHNSARDGFHILNGDPRMSWLLATGAGRDGVWYRDFNGLIKDLMVIHNRDTDGTSGRSGIYASETVAGDSNPRFVNVTLVGRDSTSVSAAPGDTEFGILFADNTDQIRMANVLIANFRNGCFLANDGADLSQIDTQTPGPNYLDGVHCANEAGANGNFGVVADNAVGFPAGTIAPNNSNGNGLVYYNGANNGIGFTGEIAERGNNFTASWYLASIRQFSNGLLADAAALNGFLDGDTNNDGIVNADDNGSPFILNENIPFNLDVASDTGGYDLTHIGAVRSGAISSSNAQFDNWTVATGRSSGNTVRVAQ